MWIGKIEMKSAIDSIIPRLNAAGSSVTSEMSLPSFPFIFYTAPLTVWQK
jgi:hypothetical protein